MKRILRCCCYLLIVLFLASGNLIGQGTNSFCYTPLEIENPQDFCSSLGEFDNLNASVEIDELFYPIDDCWSGIDDLNNDVWFRFTAEARAVNILVVGSANGGSLLSPQVSLILDNGCTGSFTPIQCGSDRGGLGLINIFRGGLIIGESYLIRVDGRDGNVGTFQLCVTNFNPPVEPGQDCGDASILCDKSSFIVQSVSGSGQDPDEGAGTCIAGGFGASERQSTWFRWTAANNGSLSFTITPKLLTDDIDWVLFELSGGIDDCGSKFPIRCNATFGGDNASCGPLTGMRDASDDLEEDGGCDPGEDGFTRSINMVEGTSYALLVNNWTESGVGFQMDFSGTGEFLGPEPLFLPNVNLEILECDTEVTFTDESIFSLGEIVNWEWNFGRGSNPQIATGRDSKQVVYESIGDKIASLTVESDRGCLVTYTLPFTILPCCDDFSDLDIDLQPTDLICANDPTGSISAQGLGGRPEYNYRIGDGDYSRIPVFENLAADTYTVYVQDTKGCIFSDDVVVDQPAPLEVTASDDVTEELGIPVTITASYQPPEYDVMLDWTPMDGITCVDPECFELEVIAPGTTTYLVTATNEFGCTATDLVVVTTIDNKDIYRPNAISRTGDVDNYFRLFSGPAGSEIEELIVYDRWGNQMYRGSSLPLTTGLPDDESQRGWNGTFKGKYVNPGMYSWLAKVRFVDNDVITYSGDINVID